MVQNLSGSVKRITCRKAIFRQCCGAVNADQQKDTGATFVAPAPEEEICAKSELRTHAEVLRAEIHVEERVRIPLDVIANGVVLHRDVEDSPWSFVFPDIE